MASEYDRIADAWIESTPEGEYKSMHQQMNVTMRHREFNAGYYGQGVSIKVVDGGESETNMVIYASNKLTIKEYYNLVHRVVDQYG